MGRKTKWHHPFASNNLFEAIKPKIDNQTAKQKKKRWMKLLTKGTFEHTYLESMSDIGTRVVEKGEERAQEAAASTQCGIRRKEKMKKIGANEGN